MYQRALTGALTPTPENVTNAPEQQPASEQLLLYLAEAIISVVQSTRAISVAVAVTASFVLRQSSLALSKCDKPVHSCLSLPSAEGLQSPLPHLRP